MLLGLGGQLLVTKVDCDRSGNGGGRRVGLGTSAGQGGHDGQRGAHAEHGATARRPGADVAGRCVLGGGREVQRGAQPGGQGQRRRASGRGGGCVVEPAGGVGGAQHQFGDRLAAGPLGPLEVRGELGCGGLPRPAQLGHCAFEGRADRPGHAARAQVRHRIGGHPPQHAVDGVGAGFVGGRGVRGGAGQPGEQGRRQRVDIGGRRGRLAAQHLGGGVQHARGHPASAVRPGLPQRPGQAEVRELRRAVPGNQNVLRLDVAVQDSGGVRGLQRAGDRDAGGDDGAPRRGGAGGDPVGEGPAILVRHQDVRVARRGVTSLVHRDDVRMAGQPAHRPQLPLEAQPRGASTRTRRTSASTGVARSTSRASSGWSGTTTAAESSRREGLAGASVARPASGPGPRRRCGRAPLPPRTPRRRCPVRGRPSAARPGRAARSASPW